MESLLEEENDPRRDMTYTHSSAHISHDGVYRYELRRTWGDEGLTACFIGLNPSTADADKDDATIRRCVSFAQSWGCGSLLMLNLFAYRAKKPKDLIAAEKRGVDIVGLGNRPDLVAVRTNGAAYVVAAWGARGNLLNMQRAVCAEISGLWCLGETKHGCPKHPLYLAANTELRLYRDRRMPSGW